MSLCRKCLEEGEPLGALLPPIIVEEVSDFLHYTQNESYIDSYRGYLTPKFTLASDAPLFEGGWQKALIYPPSLKGECDKSIFIWFKFEDGNPVFFLD
jgi:hypothetical protein